MLRLVDFLSKLTPLLLLELVLIESHSVLIELFILHPHGLIFILVAKDLSLLRLVMNEFHTPIFGESHLTVLFLIFLLDSEPASFNTLFINSLTIVHLSLTLLDLTKFVAILCLLGLCLTLKTLQESELSLFCFKHGSFHSLVFIQ